MKGRSENEGGEREGGICAITFRGKDALWKNTD